MVDISSFLRRMSGCLSLRLMRWSSSEWVGLSPALPRLPVISLPLGHPGSADTLAQQTPVHCCLLQASGGRCTVVP